MVVMKRLLNLLTLNFIPRSSDFGLLILRVALGAGMIYLHGWNKWINFSKYVDAFNDPLNIGKKLSLGLVVFAEVVCSALLIIGFGTRFAALVLAFTMGVALFVVHKGILSVGETSALYLLGYVILLIAGPGKFSCDGGGGGEAKPH